MTAGCGDDSPSADSGTTTTDAALATTTTAAGSSTTASTVAAAGSSTSSTAAQPTTTRRPTTLKVTKADNNKQQTLHVGSSIEVRLEECGGCGYEWRVTTKPDPKVLKETAFRTETTTTTSSGAMIVGTPSDYVWTFKAVGTGTTSVVIKNYGPDGKPDEKDTFTMRVQVLA